MLKVQTWFTITQEITSTISYQQCGANALDDFYLHNKKFIEATKNAIKTSEAELIDYRLARIGLEFHVPAAAEKVADAEEELMFDLLRGQMVEKQDSA